MPEGVFEINNPLGLHARAAANVSRAAETFKSEITLYANGKMANAKSILSLLTLAAAKGTEIKVVVEGVDEDNALKAMGDLIENKFGEK